MARKTPVYPAGGPKPGGPYSPAIIAGGFVFVSGQVPKKPGTAELVQGDIVAQTRQVLENVKLTLEAAGASMADVVKVTAHLSDLKEFAVFNSVYETYFPEPRPARTTVQSVLAPGVNVEVDVIAIHPGEESPCR
ncbi:MAG TPA: Rid family detoxifying hydrolase [Symbiobacteriaceae bacterium]|nr:Rid family detoxifying hydrolase [Symbiobacteriaceae bacterium]